MLGRERWIARSSTPPIYVYDTGFHLFFLQLKKVLRTLLLVEVGVEVLVFNYCLRFRLVNSGLSGAVHPF